MKENVHDTPENRRVATALDYAEHCLRAISEKFDCPIIIRFGDDSLSIIAAGVHEGENLLGSGPNLTQAIAAALVKEL